MPWISVTFPPPGRLVKLDPSPTNELAVALPETDIF